MATQLFIISNESIYTRRGEFFCDNLDMKSLPEGLSNNFEIKLLARRSNKDRTHKINLKNINYERFLQKARRFSFREAVGGCLEPRSNKRRDTKEEE